MKLNFDCISESLPGPKWKTLFQTHWSAYRAWFESKQATERPSLVESRAAVKQYVPEWIPTYERLCELAEGDRVAARFLTGYCPPAYISGCSQAVLSKTRQLIRNYDYNPTLSEGTLLHSCWNGRNVIAVGDCLFGVVDGMNDDGLAISLTFGGRKVVGKGFGIPLLLRFVLEFCSDVQQAVEALKKIPTNMSYNVTVLDKTGAHRTVQLSPDGSPKVTDRVVATNHQGNIDWPEHAQFSQTLERENFLETALELEGQTDNVIVESFLKSPLYNRRYREGFGTLYTAVYRPNEGSMSLRWPDKRLDQSFDSFQESSLLIDYSEYEVAVPELVPAYSYEPAYPVAVGTGQTDSTTFWIDYGNKWAAGDTAGLARMVAQSLLQAMGNSGKMVATNFVERFTNEAMERGDVPWEMLADIEHGNNIPSAKETRDSESATVG